jgi:hypothetical protein
MAQSGYTPISLYYSSTTGAVPTAGQLVNGEFGLNIRDGKLFYKNAAGVVTTLANSSGGTVTFPLSVSNGGTGLTTLPTGQIPYGNGTSAFSSSSSLDFDGTTLIVGPGSTLGGTTNPYLAVVGNANGYIQQYIYNASSGTSASSDFVAYPDNGLDSSGWVDFGIGSSTFSDAVNYPITLANEGYILMSSPAGASKTGNLVYATDSTGTANSHQWYVGGFTAAKGAWKMQLTSTGLQLANALGVAYGGTGLTSTPSNGQIDIGNGTGFTRSTLSAGTGVSISNTSGAITISATGSGGTVTTVSVVSTNGFTGTVANATTTPAITLTTSITGLLQGNGTALSAVTIGTGIGFTGGTISNSLPMTYPSGSGIAVVSSGTSWGTTLTAPSGAIVGTTDTQTLTNKRVTPRIGTTTSSATITPTSDLSDQYNVTALATTATFAIPSGTPTDGQKLSIRIKDSGSGQTISWTTTAGGYRVIGTTLPTSIAAGKTIYVGCVYNAADAFWDVVAVATQA